MKSTREITILMVKIITSKTLMDHREHLGASLTLVWPEPAPVLGCLVH